MTFIPRIHANGGVCCSQYDADGRRVTPTADAMCDACRAHFASLNTEEDTMTDIPNPYEHDLKKLRAANATPESTFEEDWKAERLHALAAEYRAADLRTAERSTPCLMEAEAASFAPPNPYAAHIKGLQSKETP